MSLILDALNRADTERKNQTPVPDLNTQHRPLALEPEQSARAWYWWVAAALIIVLVAVIIWRWQTTNTSPTATAISPVQPAPAKVQPPVSQPVTPAVVAPVQPLQPLPSQSAASLASAVAVRPDSSGVAATDIKDLYAEDAAPEPTMEADVSQLYAPEEATGSESVVDPFASPSVAQAALPPAEVVREPARTFDSMTHVQDFNELPWNTKQKMPTISYQRHDYLAGGISSVVINGQTLGVGNIVATGQFVVLDILVDGVVLKHGDRVFKLRALNGWINM